MKTHVFNLPSGKLLTAVESEGMVSFATSATQFSVAEVQELTSKLIAAFETRDSLSVVEVRRDGDTVYYDIPTAEKVGK